MLQDRTKLILSDPEGNIIIATDRGAILKSDKHLSSCNPNGHIAPDELILKWTAKFPFLGKDEISAAIHDQFLINNPFPDGEATKATHILENPNKTKTVYFFLASKPQILEYFAKKRNLQLTNPHELGEIWHPVSDGLLINLPGFGEITRIKKSFIQKRYTNAVLILFILLLCATALTPVLQLRIKAISASNSFKSLAIKAEPFIKQRELLARSQQQLNTINTALGGLIVPMDILDSLSQAMPDTAHLVSLELTHESSTSDLVTVKLTGKSQNTLELIKALSSTGVFTDLKLATSVVRQPGTSQEFFSLIGNYKKQSLFEAISINTSKKEGNNEE